MSDLKTVLIVEDDLAIREILSEALRLEGYGVATATNGVEGLEKIRVIPHPNLVLLDMMMPIMDGRGFLDAIIADPHLVSIPVIIISSDLTDDQKCGAKKYMKKPADLNLLLRWIEDYTRDPAP
jgi:CheY-like chemotaxis protein